MEKATNSGIKFIEHFKQNWKWWVFGGLYILTLVFFYTAISQGFIFDSYQKEVDKRHQESVEFRMRATPVINGFLNNLAAEMGALRTYIMEYHNGKSNPTGMQWQYADLTFINDKTEDISYEYQNVPLVKYPLAYHLHQHIYFVGTIEELDKIDHKLALRMGSNDVKYCAMMMIYGSNVEPIGYLGISFSENPNIDKYHINSVLHKYVSAIAPYLDNANVGTLN